MPTTVLGDYCGLPAKLIRGNVDGEALDLKPGVGTPLFALPDFRAYQVGHDAEVTFEDSRKHVTRR